MASVWEELKRRNVVKVGVAYAIVAWLLIQVAVTVLPVFEAPDWIARVFTFFVILGFPAALVIAWAYELTSDGIERTSDVPASESITRATGQKLNYIIIGALALILVVTIFSYEMGEPPAPEPEVVADERSNELEILPNSIAVLPFENMSLDPNDAFFAAGVHEEILNRLAKLSALNVIARTSVMQYAEGGKTIPQIAEELNVGTVMEGSVRYADGRVLITAQLIDAETNAHLWSEAYNEEFANIFSVQADVAMNIANALKVQFSLEEQAKIEQSITDSPEAYALFLRANAMIPNPAFALPDVLATANTLLDQAIELDPDFARAYVLRSGTYRNLGEQVRRQDIEKALQLDPKLGFAHALVAEQHWLNWRFDDARKSYELAVQASPNEPEVLIRYALSLAEASQHEKALQLATRAVNLDPKNARFLEWLAMVHLFAGDRDRAFDATQQSVAVDPAYSASYLLLGQIAASQGNVRAAMDSLGKYERLRGASVRGWRQLAYGYHLAGLSDEVDRLVATYMDADELSHYTAHVVAERDRALEIWTDIFEERRRTGRGFLLLRANVFNDSVLNEPEFVKIRNSVPIPE